MGKRIKCLKVGKEFFEIGDIVAIPQKYVTGEKIHRGRICGFEEVGQRTPRDVCVVLDTSEKFKRAEIRINVEDIYKCTRLEEDAETQQPKEQKHEGRMSVIPDNCEVCQFNAGNKSCDIRCTLSSNRTIPIVPLLKKDSRPRWCPLEQLVRGRL